MTSTLDDSQAVQAVEPGRFPWQAAAMTLAKASGLLILVFIAFAPALRGGFIWDDNQYLVGNAAIRTGAGLLRAWTHLTATPQYYPMVFTSFFAEYRLWGFNPAGYHVVNLIIHALSAIVLWRCLVRLKVPGAWIAAALFAVHPVQTESVAWITERKNLLSALFFLLSAMAYLRFDPMTPNSATGVQHRKYAWYAVSLLLFVAALLSKTVACSLPAVLLLVMWWKRDRLPGWRGILPLIPMFVLGLVMARITAWVEWNHVGAKDLHLNLNFADRIVLAGRCIVFYVGKLVWPARLTFIYPQWHIDARELTAWAYPAAVVLAIVGLYLARRRIGKGPVVAALVYCGTLVPALGFVDVFPMRYSFVADHFQYVSTIGALAIAGAAFAWLLARVKRPGILAPMTAVVACVVISYTQSKSYASLETLWRDTLARNESAWMAHNNLGALLCVSGRTAEGEPHLLRALSLKPDHVDAMNNLALLKLVEGKPVEAAAICRRALAVQPDHAPVHLTLGRADAAQGDMKSALAEFAESVRLDPQNSTARAIYAMGLLADGRFQPARQEFRKALQLDPDEALAKAHAAALDRPDSSMLMRAQGEAQLFLRPNDFAAFYNTAAMLSMRGSVREALPYAQRAVQLKPDSADPQNLLGSILLQSNDYAAAIVHLERAVQIDPKIVEAQFNLGIAYSAASRSKEAIAQFRQVLQLSPNDPEASQRLAAELRKASQ